jgi:hypothetical protein
VCLCSLSYSACKAHAPYLYCPLWPVWLYRIFPHYLINGTIFGKKKIIDHKTCVFIFSTTSVRNNTSLFNNSARYYQKCTYVFMWSNRYSWRILMKLEFSLQIYKSKMSNVMKIHPVEAELFRTGRKTWMTNRIVAFRNNNANESKTTVTSTILLLIGFRAAQGLGIFKWALWDKTSLHCPSLPLYCLIRIGLKKALAASAPLARSWQSDIVFRLPNYVQFCSKI